tara:strand:+ start:256 stop:549 length:294 start_codon:yes stop_codon:yes gene_type:complete
MSKIVNITAATTTTTLLQAGTQDTGRISKIHISNNDSSSEDISVYLHDGSSSFYFIKDLTLPANTSFLLEDCLSFDVEKYTLKIDHENSPNLSIIIK